MKLYPLHKAVIECDLATIHSLLKGCIDIDQRDEFFYTPLHVACDVGASLEILQVLIKHGASLHDRADHKYTPLILICDEGYKEVQFMRLMSSRKEAAPDVWFELSSIFNYRIGAATYFVTKNADINAVDNRRQSILHQVARNGIIEYCSYCLQVDFDGISTSDYVDLINAAFFAGGALDDERVSLINELLKVYYQGKVKVADAFLLLGADAKLIDSDGKAAYDYARNSGNLILYKMLEVKSKSFRL